MLSRLEGSRTEARRVQLEKVLAPICVTPSGISIELSELQFEKAAPAIEVRAELAVKLTLASELQLMKVLADMEVAEEGNAKSVRALQPEKAEIPMVLVLSGTTADTRAVQSSKA